MSDGRTDKQMEIDKWEGCESKKIETIKKDKRKGKGEVSKLEIK